MSDPERIVVRLRSHGRALVLPAVLLCAIAFGTTFALGRVAWELWDVVVVTVAVVLTVALCIVPTLAWLSRRVVVTSRRVIVRSAFGGQKRDVPLARIHDVTLRRQGIQAVLGSGDVLLSTGGEQPVTLADVPSASLVQRTLTDLVAQTPMAQHPGAQHPGAHGTAAQQAWTPQPASPLQHPNAQRVDDAHRREDLA